MLAAKRAIRRRRLAAQCWLASDFDGNGADDIVLVYGRKGDARVWRERSVGRGFAYVDLRTIGTFELSQRWLSAQVTSSPEEDLVRVSSEPWY